MPPELEVGFPEPRCVVKFAQPPAADGNHDDDHEFQPVSQQQGSPRESVNQRIGKKNVAGPDDGSEPMSNELISPEQQAFSQTHDQDSDVAMRRKSLLSAAGVHRS